MVFKSYKEMVGKVQCGQPLKIVVAAACDSEIIKTIGVARELASFILIGDKKKLLQMGEDYNVDLKSFLIIDEPDPIKASKVAILQINCGNADCLMKGFINTSDLMRLVLDKQTGLRTEKMLSHIAALEISGFSKIVFVTDAGLNVAPSLEEKKRIIQNGVDFLKDIGYDEVKVAVLAANEVPNPRQPVTMDATVLKEMAQKGEIKGAIVDGPLSFDLAVSEKAAQHKNIESPVAGKADLLVVPSIEAGNLLCKGIMYCANAVMAGLVLGAKVPILLVSRASSVDEKTASIAMASLMKQNWH